MHHAIIDFAGMLQDVISRARNRFILNEVLKQCAVAGTVTSGAIALILLLGTRWLDWWTLAVPAVVACGIAVWQLRRRMPSNYSAAMRLDRAARLNDALSTALHFNGLNTAFAEGQREQANAAAQSLNLSAAIPLQIPRMLYALGGVLLLALTLLLVRYGVAHTLDLRAPLTDVIFEDQAAHRPLAKKMDAREALRRSNLESAESLLARMGVPVSPDEAQNQQTLDRAIEQALAPPSAVAGEQGQKGNAPGKAENGRGGDGAEKQPAGDPMEDKAAPDSKDAASKGEGDKGSSKSGSGGDNSSLLSRLKDAVSSLFSKASESKDQSAEKGASQQKDQSKAGKSKSDKAASKGQQDDNSPDAQEGQQDGDAKDGQEAQSKAASKSSQQSGQSGSGVGNQDGAKDLRAAEQLRAMGKLSQILGKRAAGVSGETMVEVQSGNQKLTTAYSNKTGTHREAEGDVSRDEIPVDLQPYVRQYFEQVHKPAAAPRTAPR